jgi:hypothetical protein
MSLSNDQIKLFFSSLYEDGVADSEVNFDKSEAKILASKADEIVAGEKGLQAMLFNYLLSNKDALTESQAQDLPALLVHIKQRAVDEFTKAFPQTNLDSLVEAAKDAGYDVQILG